MISKDINLAAQHLNDNGIIGFPTETVYGLAGNAFNTEAIHNIFEVKKRPTFNPLIVHIKGIEDLKQVATEIPPIAYELANAFWPGPLTLILKKQHYIPDLVTANQDTVAVRVPNHPVALELLNAIDFPLVAPSANPFTSISPTSAEHVENYFGNQINMVLEGGECSAGIESTIIGFENNRVVVYRLGALALEEIEKVSGSVTLLNKKDKKPIAPGMLMKHYAPKTDFILTRNVHEELDWYTGKKIGLLLFNSYLPDFDSNSQIVLSGESDLKMAASKLYSAMHQLDKMNLDLIIAERLPEYGLGVSINDRLERASKKINTQLTS
ncbi:threonylcarbamoyl-AMP synthase [Flavobacterium sp. LMO8]|uniref:L-threonylcarbamoyladenylate synthase n=1 Tax=Flavobacterium sp. LMO8 TaxID=2654244 RepID=UPI00129161ED|nr:L-threonylcarbamoyladenylate synthase [Flavobacterium sp. LMO8]MQP24186.1 threonylcarbamoyl-AMP synthase [Flavobacterium sp. LMO8]